MCILGISEINAAPYIPRSHPCVVITIGSIRREYLEFILFGIPTVPARNLIDIR